MSPDEALSEVPTAATALVEDTLSKLFFGAPGGLAAITSAATFKAHLNTALTASLFFDSAALSGRNWWEDSTSVASAATVSIDSLDMYLSFGAETSPALSWSLAGAEASVNKAALAIDLGVYKSPFPSHPSSNKSVRACASRGFIFCPLLPSPCAGVHTHTHTYTYTHSLTCTLTHTPPHTGIKSFGLTTPLSTGLPTSWSALQTLAQESGIAAALTVRADANAWYNEQNYPAALVVYKGKCIVLRLALDTPLRLPL